MVNLFNVETESYVRKDMKKKTIIFCLVIIAWAGLFSCALNSNTKKAQEEAKRKNAAIAEDTPEAVTVMKGPSPDWTEEVVMSLLSNHNELAIRVGTGGCTKKEDFWIWCHFDEESKGGTPHYVLTVYRMRKDECKAFYPSGVLIKFNLREELALPNVFTYTVTNRVHVGVFLNK